MGAGGLEITPSRVVPLLGRPHQSAPLTPSDLPLSAPLCSSCSLPSCRLLPCRLTARFISCLLLMNMSPSLGSGGICDKSPVLSFQIIAALCQVMSKNPQNFSSWGATCSYLFGGHGEHS